MHRALARMSNFDFPLYEILEVIKNFHSFNSSAVDKFKSLFASSCIFNPEILFISQRQFISMRQQSH